MYFSVSETSACDIPALKASYAPTPLATPEPIPTIVMVSATAARIFSIVSTVTLRPFAVSAMPLATLETADAPPPARPAPREAAMIATVMSTCARICDACLLSPMPSRPLASFSTILSITPVSLSTWHPIAIAAPMTGPTARPPVAMHATTAATTARAVISQPNILLALRDSAALSMSLRDFSIFSERLLRSASSASFCMSMRSLAIAV